MIQKELGIMDLNIPESAIKAVSKKLKHYIDVERREEGFDMSPAYNLTGHFSSSKGTAGTFFYNSLQDRHLQHYYDQPTVRKHLENMGVIHPGMVLGKKMRRRAQSAREQQRMSARMESERLLGSAAKLLLSSGYCSYYKEPSSPGCSQSNGSTSRRHRWRSPSSHSSYTHSTTTKSHATPSRPSTPGLPHSTHPHNTPPSTPVTATNEGSTSLTYPPFKSADVISSPINQPLITASPTHTICTPVASPPRLIKCNVGVSTVSSCEASTQTPVNASTQTDLSKLLETSMCLRKRNKQKTSRRTSLTSPGAGDTTPSLYSLAPTGDTTPSLHSLAPAGTITPNLHSLAQAGDTERLKELLSADSASVNTLNEQGQSLLHVACIAGNDELTKTLCELGCDLSLETPTGYSAAHCAALHGHAHCLKVLMTLGCDIDCPTIDKLTPLHLAARSGHVECCKWLVANGASVHAEDNGDRTPRDVAMDNGHTVLEALLSPSASETVGSSETVCKTDHACDQKVEDDEFWTN